MKKLIDIIAGARPNFMKIAPIIRAIQDLRKYKEFLDFRLIHTGQQYDSKLSATSFDLLGIPESKVNLEVGSGTQAEQTNAIMTRYKKVLMDAFSKFFLVVGDVTLTMACAINSQKSPLALLPPRI